MPSIGETLREARIRRKLDIADVEARTKIRAKYLRALENEEWGALPGHTFVKTFLRTYAEVVGVDAQVLVEEYRTTQEFNDEDLEAESVAVQPRRRRPRESRGRPREPRRRPREPRRRPPPGPPSRAAVALGAIVAVVGFLLLLGLLSEDEDPGSKRAGGETQTEREPQRARRRPPRRPPAAGVSVRIAPTTPTYACIDTGEGTGIVFEGTLEAPRTFKNPKRLRLNLGKRALDLRVNGKRVQIAPSPEPVGFDLTPTGVKEITEGTRPCA